LNLSRKSEGFTIIEVLIAIIILSVALLALAGLMTTTTKNNSWGAHMTEAATFAQDRLEELRATPWTMITTGSDTRHGATGIVYTRSWEVVPNTTDTLRTVAITLNWNDRVSHSIRLLSVIWKQGE